MGNALHIIIQIAGLMLATFAGGFALGRFWFSRSLEIKNTIIDTVEARNRYLTELIERSEDLQQLKKEAARLEKSNALFAREDPLLVLGTNTEQIKFIKPQKKVFIKKKE